MKKQYTIGIDVGGTKMLAVLFDGKNVIADYELSTPKDSYDHFLTMIKALVEPLLEKAGKDKVTVSSIGLGVAGVVDKKFGGSLESPNIEILNNKKLVADIEKMFEADVFIDNDTNCFLRAEMAIGASRKNKNAYGFIVGTGIGGAWYFDEKIYAGSSGAAGEPGAMILDCAEKLNIETAYQKLTQNNTWQLSEEAYAGDPLAQKAFDELANILAIVISNVVNLIDPEVIVLGGGAINASDLFLAKTKKLAKEYIISPEAKKIKILKSKLEGQAGAIGAAMLEE